MQPFAKVQHLWCLGVGAVISGLYFGWQNSLVGGVGGVAITLPVVFIMYLGLCLSVAELSSIMSSHSGGPYAFARRAMGIKGGYITALAETLKVVMTVAVVACGVGSYITELLQCSQDYSPIWWLIAYGLFLTLNITGVEASFNVQATFTTVSVLLLVVFYAGAAPSLDYTRWVAVENWVWVGGVTNIMRGLPWSMWFFLGIEELPLATKETIDPNVNMPKGILFSLVTLAVLAVCTVVFSVCISPGAHVIFLSTSPLLVGYKSVYGDTAVIRAVSWILLTGLLSSIHSFIFCMGSLIAAIAQDRTFPFILAYRHSKYQTPVIALIGGGLVGFGISVLIFYLNGQNLAALGGMLINLSLSGALVSYIMQLLSFIVIRRGGEVVDAPYTSPLGLPGATLSLALSVMMLYLIFHFAVIDEQWVFLGVLGSYIMLGGLYFQLLDPAEISFRSTEKLSGESMATSDDEENDEVKKRLLDVSDVHIE